MSKVVKPRRKLNVRNRDSEDEKDDEEGKDEKAGTGLFVRKMNCTSVLREVEEENNLYSVPVLPISNQLTSTLPLGHASSTNICRVRKMQLEGLMPI
jgi:hypothetical protein